MNIFSIIRTAYPLANGLAALAVALLVLKLLMFNAMAPIFTRAYEFGLAFESILVSVISSYVFYIFVVHFKECSDKNIMEPFVRRHSLRLVGACKQQLEAISSASGVALAFNEVTEVEIRAALKNIDPYSTAPLALDAGGRLANWLQYFNFQVQRSGNSIDKLLGKLLFLSPHHVSLLSELDDSTHFSQTRIFNNVKIDAPTLEFHAKSLLAYCKICQRLDIYNSRL